MHPHLDGVGVPVAAHQARGVELDGVRHLLRGRRKADRVGEKIERELPLCLQVQGGREDWWGALPALPCLLFARPPHPQARLTGQPRAKVVVWVKGAWACSAGSEGEQAGSARGSLPCVEAAQRALRPAGSAREFQRKQPTPSLSLPERSQQVHNPHPPLQSKGKHATKNGLGGKPSPHPTPLTRSSRFSTSRPCSTGTSTSISAAGGQDWVQGSRPFSGAATCLGAGLPMERTAGDLFHFFHGCPHLLVAWPAGEPFPRYTEPPSPNNSRQQLEAAPHPRGCGSPRAAA